MFPNSSCLKEGFDLVLYWTLIPPSINSQSKTLPGSSCVQGGEGSPGTGPHLCEHIPSTAITRGESWPAAPLSCCCPAQPQSSSQSTERMESTGRAKKILQGRDWEEELRIQTKQPVFLYICKLFIYRTENYCWQLPGSVWFPAGRSD